VLANAIYGASGSFESRLFREVREKRGLVYGVSSSLDADRGPRHLHHFILGGALEGRRRGSVGTSELRRMQDEDVSPDELARAKTRIVAQQLNAEQATSTIAADLMRIALDDLPSSYYATLAERYAATTRRTSVTRPRHIFTRTTWSRCGSARRRELRVLVRDRPERQ